MGSKTPNPGSAEAIKRGCKCPVIDNPHGKGVPHGKDGAPLFWISERCSMHMAGKALEAAAREIAANHWSVDSDMDKQAYQDAHWQFHVDDAETAISAYLSALPGEAEVKGYLFRLRYGPDRWSHQLMFSAVLPKDGDAKEIEPLVALASLQAMQARAEKAERERDEANQAFKALIVAMAQEGMGAGNKEGGGIVIKNRRAETAEARVKDAMGLLDHLIGWIVHDCGAEPPFTSEQDETYATLCAVAKALQVSR